MNNLAFSYVRVSSREQLKGVGIQRQLEAAEKYCLENNLNLSPQTYADLGISAYTEKNLKEGSELRALIGAIENGVIPFGSTLIIENLDRLSRSFITTSLPLFLQIIDYGIRIVTLSDKRTYSKETINKDSMELFASILILTRAKEESDMKKQRITDAWRRRQQNADKKKIATSYPSWLVLKDGEFAILEEQTKIIRRIFNDYDGGASVASIARSLNVEKIKTFNGKVWNSTLVKFFLRNPAVIGEYHVGRRMNGKKVKTGQVHEKYYPAIIQKDLFNRVQFKLQLNPSKNGRPQRDDANLFQGIIKCPYCGGSMGIYNASKSNSFICWNSVSGACIRSAIDRNFVEAAVLTSTLEIAKAVVLDTGITTKRILELESELVVVQKRRDNLIELVVAMGNGASMAKKMTELEKQITELSNTLEEEKILVSAETSMRNALDLIGKVISGDASPEDRMKLVGPVRRYVERIETYFVGDKFAEYKKALENQNGAFVYKKIRKRLKIEACQYVKVFFKFPIVINGESVSEKTFRREWL